MENDSRRVALFEESDKQVKRVRTLALGSIVFLLAILVMTVTTVETEFLHLMWGLFLVLGVGVVSNIHVYRNPEIFVRQPPEHSVKQIVAHRGEHLLAGMEGSTVGEKRLVVQDALDSTRKVRKERGLSGPSGLMIGFACLASFFGAVSSLVMGLDPLFTLFLLLILLKFAFLSGMSFWTGKRARKAETILERLLMAVDAGVFDDFEIDHPSPR